MCCENTDSAIAAIAKKIPKAGRRLFFARGGAVAFANSQKRVQVNSVYQLIALKICSAFRTKSDEVLVVFRARRMERHVQRRDMMRSETYDL